MAMVCSDLLLLLPALWSAHLHPMALLCTSRSSMMILASLWKYWIIQPHSYCLLTVTKHLKPLLLNPGCDLMSGMEEVIVFGSGQLRQEHEL